METGKEATAKRGEGPSVTQQEPQAEPVSRHPQAKATLIAAVIAALASLIVAGVTVVSQYAAAQRSANLQATLESVKARLQRQGAAEEFLRTRLVSHLDQVLAGWMDASVLAEMLILRSFLTSEDFAKTEREFRTALTRVETNVQILRAYGVLKGESKDFDEALRRVRESWDKIQGEGYRGTNEFREAFPTDRGRSEENYLKLWVEFRGEFRKLQRIVLEVPAHVDIQKAVEKFFKGNVV